MDRPVEDLDRDRPALAVQEQPVHDLQRAAATVARVAAAGEGAAAALEERGGDVVEDEAAACQVAAGEPALDRLLTREQPVHRGVQVVRVRPHHAELLRQRRLRELTGAGELRARREHPLADHRQGAVALLRGRPLEQARKPQPAGHRQHAGRMPVRQRALQLERIRRGQKLLALQAAPNQLDQVVGQVGEVGQRLLPDLAALAVAAAKQVGDVLLPFPLPARRDHMHRALRTSPPRHMKDVTNHTG